MLRCRFMNVTLMFHESLGWNVCYDLSEFIVFVSGGSYLRVGNKKERDEFQGEPLVIDTERNC